jgi:hypothetical protein
MAPAQQPNLPNKLTYEKGCEAIHPTEAEDPRGGTLTAKVMSGSTTLVAALSASHATAKNTTAEWQ